MRWEVRERTDGRRSWDLRGKREIRKDQEERGKKERGAAEKDFFGGGSEAVEKHGPAGWEESGNGRLKLS